MRLPPGQRPRCALLFAALAWARTLAIGHHARAADADPAPAPTATGEPDHGEADAVFENEGFVLPAGVETAPALSLMGYVDFGFANAGGDGTSYPPGDNMTCGAW